VNRHWSARRVCIESRRGELARQFQRDHGRLPTPVEMLHLAQQATWSGHVPTATDSGIAQLYIFPYVVGGQLDGAAAAAVLHPQSAVPMGGEYGPAVAVFTQSKAEVRSRRSLLRVMINSPALACDRRGHRHSTGR
jgi:hypothetical protein